MKVLAVVVAVILGACAASPAKVRMKEVARTRTEAMQVAGARQAAAFAEAVHDSYIEGDYAKRPQVLAQDAADAVAVIDRALGGAGVDEAMLVAWRALMLGDVGRGDESLAEMERSFAIAPNYLAGINLIVVYGRANRADLVGPTCAATVEVLTSADDKLAVIQLCRTNMNAVSNEGEMAWMSPELIEWYQAENAARLQADVDVMVAQRQRDEKEAQVVRDAEQCGGRCEQRSLTCQNRCYDDADCEERCVGIEQSCRDVCVSEAHEELGY